MLSPVIIGATGGSGTRAVRGVLRTYGAHMGVHVNDSGDAIDFGRLYNEHINPTLSHTGRLDYQFDRLPASISAPAMATTGQCLAAYLARFDAATGPWGFKNPRSMFVLPYLHRAIPDMAFLHMIRDGRDMVLSSTQNAVHFHYAALFGRPPGDDIAAAAARLWTKANTEVADWCAGTLQGRHLIVRYEDLCRDPTKGVSEILGFLGWPHRPSQIAELASTIMPSSTTGRWRQLPADRMAPLHAIMSPALYRFGYGDGR